jgi:uncharacterized membrane protein YagU involved in acid resistance
MHKKSGVKMLERVKINLRRFLVLGRAFLPVVIKKFPQLALWSAAIYGVVDILITLLN